MPKIRLTDMAIKRLKPPQQGAVTYWDDASPVGLRLSQGGARTFIVLLASGQRRKIGRYPVLKLSEAREQARRILAKRTLGQEQPRTITFPDALELFLETHCKLNNKRSTAKETERVFSPAPSLWSSTLRVEGIESSSLLS